jgi:hypothetical protein
MFYFGGPITDALGPCDLYVQSIDRVLLAVLIVIISALPIAIFYIMGMRTELWAKIVHFLAGLSVLILLYIGLVLSLFGSDPNMNCGERSNNSHLILWKILIVLFVICTLIFMILYSLKSPSKRSHMRPWTEKK